MSVAAILAVVVMALLLGIIAGWTAGERHTLARWEYAEAEREDAENVRRRDMRGQANEDFYNSHGSTR